MDRDCRCEGLNEMMRQQRGQFQGQELIREMMQMAENLPNERNLSPQRCDIDDNIRVTASSSIIDRDNG